MEAQKCRSADVQKCCRYGGTEVQRWCRNKGAEVVQRCTGGADADAREVQRWYGAQVEQVQICKGSTVQRFITGDYVSDFCRGGAEEVVQR